MGVAASCTNCWRGDGPTSTKVRHISSTEDVAAYEYPPSSSPIDRDMRSVGTNAISPSPASHLHSSVGPGQHSPAISKVGSAVMLPHQNMANSGRSLERSHTSVDKGKTPVHVPPESPIRRPPVQALAESTTSSSSGDYEMPEEQPQEQQAVDALMFDGRVETAPTASHSPPVPSRPRSAVAAAPVRVGQSTAATGRSPSATRVGDVSLQQKPQSSWDRGSSSSDEDEGPRRRRMGGFVPGVGATKPTPSATTRHHAAAAQHYASNNIEEDEEDDDDDDDYQGPQEDAPALHM